MLQPTSIECLATVIFALAVVHTFSVKWFQHLALRFPDGSVGENFCHLLGEVEIVFGLWAGILVLILSLTQGATAVSHIESLNFTEPGFVFVIMTIAATRPIVQLAASLMDALATVLPLPQSAAFYFVALVIGPLLGSLITEPAAMTVTALVLRTRYFDHAVSSRFRYLTLGVLFVNISIGGVLTHFAAPPVLMVARPWGWGSAFMLSHFGWKAAIAVTLNAVISTALLFRELSGVAAPTPTPKPAHAAIAPPWWLTSIHVCFLALVVLTAHHPVFFVGLFLFFLGVTRITQEYQEELKLKESLLVGFFLAGLVVLGSFQSWWLQPLFVRVDALGLYLGATALTAIMDNAALTYLGTQVPSLSDGLKYALVAGAVSGGGLTIIANAPNPAGFAILGPTFGREGVNPLALFAFALFPTLIAMSCFWLLP